MFDELARVRIAAAAEAGCLRAARRQSRKRRTSGGIEVFRPTPSGNRGAGKLMHARNQNV